MATSDILGLFTTPEQYQLAQQQAQQAQAIQFAQLDPMARANYGTFLAGQRLGGAIGGALGGEDPQLKLISQRQQILGMIDPSNPDSFAQGIQMALQTGDTQTAFILRNEMMKAQQQAQQQEIQGFKRTDYLAERDIATQARTRQATANQLFGQLKNPDGTINEQVKNQLLAFPEGRQLISEQAKVLPDLRRLGAAGAVEDDPFKIFTQDATIPKNVQTLATQYSNSLTKGLIDPEKVDAKVKELTDMTQRIQQFDQNQAQIKSNQALMDSYKQQGLQTSQAYLAIAQSNNALAQRQAGFQQQMKLDEAARKREQDQLKQEEKANKPLRPDLAKDEEADYLNASAARNLAIEANDYVNSIKAGNIKFGLKDRASIAARSAFGSNDPDVVARNDFERFKTRLVNESLRLNKGTQTEGDAQRSIKELQGAESEVDAAKAINTLAELNARKVSDAQKAIERRRINAGAKLPEVPIETLRFEPQTFTQQDVDSFLKNPKYPSGSIFVDPKGTRRVKP
jgi:uncharacterized protein (UPF0147 family)